MKIRYLVFLLFICLLNVYPYDSIIKWDKNVINGDNIKFDGKSFYFTEKDKINKENISYISLNLTESTNEAKNDLKLDQVNPEELLKRADILQKKYQDSSILVLLDEGIQRLNKDGSQYSRSRYTIKIMNEKELQKSVLSFYYSESEQKTKILMARSISPDGKVSYLKDTDIVYTSPKQDLSFFSGRKDQKIIKAIIPDVKVGSIIDYEWETEEPAPEDPNQFYTRWYFGGDKPVYQSKIKFIIPEDKAFYYVTKNFGDEATPTVTTEDGYKVYSFIRGECPPFVEEKQSPPSEEFIPYIVGSTFKEQTYLSNWLSKFIKERLVYDDDMKKTIDQIIAENNAKTDDEKIAAIYRYVQTNIRYLSIKTSLSSGFSGHPAKETFQKKYGDCIDKSILFSTLLNIVGIESYPVIVMTNSEAQPLYGELGIVSGNHAINEIHLGDKIFYLDSTSTTYKYPYFRSDDHNIKVWNPILDKIGFINPPSPESITQTFNTYIDLNNDGSGSFKKENFYTWDWDAGLREYMMSLQEVEKEALFRNIANGDFPGSILETYKHSDPFEYSKDFSLSYSYQAKNIAKKTGDFFIFSLPVKFDFNIVSTEDRKYPILYETTYGEKDKIEIKMPDDFTTKGLPENITIKNKHFEYTGKYDFIEGKLVFKSEFKRYSVRIPAEDYKDFRKDMLKINYFIKTPLILEEKGK
ncbi:MAG: hypothetical protein A2086_01370 [Spirochaetes bacterium GWD1_27_9]|nr:MAG: hypothetical protein A2Z98_13305 [Spirochaetes bacterium GWB1_27_13]OHD24428.1 MAG: hypothetical protein A2Y34_04255 [Spirochaetes bacterium GWC1_27_15]OHD36925.1 MAG: hypothetical protein A2086_01370 [Spirochaetes bacterium GWD1_27_9]